MKLFLGACCVLGSVVAWGAAPAPDAVVAADGSGQYRSLQDAISAAPIRTGRTDPRWVIFVKPGTYRERIYVQRERGNLLVRGADAATTVVTFDMHANMLGQLEETGRRKDDVLRRVWQHRRRGEAVRARPVGETAYRH